MTKEEALKKIKELENYISNLNPYTNIKMVRFTECEKPFEIGIHQVTQELWESVTGENPSRFKGNPRYPVENISYENVKDIFLPKLRELTGKNYRLPTEYEWILSASVDNTTYSGSNNIDEVAVYGTYHPKSVGSKKPNALGLYDISGNVWEMCLGHKELIVLRGGSWRSLAKVCRVTNRNYHNAYGCYSNIGFRLAKDM